MSGSCSTQGRGEVHKRILWGEPREGDHFDGLGVDGRIILKWVCKTWDVIPWTGFFFFFCRARWLMPPDVPQSVPLIVLTLL
jgi:hypothetical protein